MAILLFLGTASYRQSKIGISASVISANQDVHIGDTKEEIESRLGADIALLADFPLGIITLSPELYWIQKGGKVDDLSDPFGEVSTTFNYLEIPI